MAEITLGLIVGYMTVVAPVLVFYFSYKIYQSRRLPKGWLAVTAAIGITIARRVVAFAADYGIFPTLNEALHLADSFIIVLIIALYIVGFWSMKKSFESFAVVEKR